VSGEEFARQRRVGSGGIVQCTPFQDLCGGGVCRQEGFKLKLRQRDVDRRRERRERRDQPELAVVGPQAKRNGEAEVAEA
jgi:hypothetical protein